MLPGATGQRLSKTGCQNLFFDKKDQKLNYTLMDVLTELSKTDVCLGLLHCSFDVV